MVKAAKGGAILLGFTLVTASDAAAQIRQGLHMDVLFAPQLVQFADATNLAYELHVTNFAHTPLRLTRLLVLDSDSGVIMADLSGPALATATAALGAPATSPDRRKLAPGMRAVIYLSLPITRAPRRLRHRIEFDIVKGNIAEPARAEGGETPVSVRLSPVLGPPLRGGPWVAVYDPELERGHRRVVYAINGRARVPGRFAIDWMKAPAIADSASVGDSARTDGFGSEVLAVADAVVVATRDDFADGGQDTPVELEDATGNYIALDLGSGVYVFYEHLKNGILVRPGDQVRRGQVIARLGATGQANRPHLHLHLSDANSPLAAEGVPFTMEDATVLGSYASIAAFMSNGQWVPVPGAPRAMPTPFFPSPNMVVVFPTN